MGMIALVSLVLALAFTACFVQLGPTEHLTGIVQALTLGAGKTASSRPAYVRLGSRTIIVAVPANTCVVGDSIQLERQRRLWGYVINADPLGCRTLGP